MFVGTLPAIEYFEILLFQCHELFLKGLVLVLTYKSSSLGL